MKNRLRGLVTILAATKTALFSGIKLAIYMQVGYMLLVVLSSFSLSRLRGLLDSSLADLFQWTVSQHEDEASASNWIKEKNERIAALNLRDFSEELQGLDQYRYTANRKLASGRRDSLTLLESFALWQPVISPLLGAFGALGLVKGGWTIDWSRWFDTVKLREAMETGGEPGQRKITEVIRYETSRRYPTHVVPEHEDRPGRNHPSRTKSLPPAKRQKTDSRPESLRKLIQEDAFKSELASLKKFKSSPAWKKIEEKSPRFYDIDNVDDVFYDASQ